MGCLSESLLPEALRSRRRQPSSQALGSSQRKALRRALPARVESVQRENHGRKERIDFWTTDEILQVLSPIHSEGSTWGYDRDVACSMLGDIDYDSLGPTGME